MSASFDQIFHTGLLDLPCHRLLEVQCLKLRRPLVCLSPVAKTHIVNYTLNIVKSLCDAAAPTCIGDIIQSIDYCFPEKLKPSPQFLDEVQSHIEKGKRKTLYISADKVFSCFKLVFPRMESNVSLFLTHLMEHIMGQIVQWVVNYESKIQSGYIEATDVHHIFSLFGAPKLSKSPVCYSLPFLPRKSADYKDYAKEIQYLLRFSVQHLGIIVLIFGDSLMEELSHVRIVTESLLTEYEDIHNINLTARRLLGAIKSAQLVFDRASEVHSHVTVLSECIDDAFEDQTRLIGSCLIEAAEDGTLYNFAHYADTLFSNDCREWISILAQTPCIMRTIANEFQKILQVTLSNASSRRQAEIKLRFSDPHSCQLCTPSFGYDPVGLTSSGPSSGSCCVLTHHSDSPQSYWSNMLSGHTNYSGTSTSVNSASSSVDRVTTMPVPFSPIFTNHGFNHSLSFTSFTNPRQPKATDHFLYSNMKHISGQRSVSNSPSSFQPFHKSISESTNQDINHGQITEIIGLSTSSSSSAVNDDSIKTNPDNESSSVHEKGFSDDTDNCSSGPSSFKENQAQLMELFNFTSDMTNILPTCNHMVIAFRYLLPQLLLLPNFQLLYLADHIEALHAHATEENERSTLKDVISLLSKTRSTVSNALFNQDWVKSVSPTLAFFLKTPFCSNLYPAEGRSKLEELISSVRRTQHSSELPLVMSEFLMDGPVQVRIDHGRPKKSERIAYLFSNWLLLCKKQKRVLSNVVSSSLSSSSNSNYVLKVKKRICLEQFHIIDVASEFSDNNGMLFLFDLECWEAPKLSSIMSNVQTNTTSSSCNSSVVQTETQSVLSGSSNHHHYQLQLGSVLSVSTLTSTNTLIDHTVDLNNIGNNNSNNENDKSLILPTAGDAVEASNNALLEVISSYPKQRFTFIFYNKEDKANWISALVYLHLARLFKRYLTSLPRQDLPLILPSPSVYRYAVPDSPSNIIFESSQTDGSAGIPVIRAATILKLIERMTYHEYFDNKTLNAFLLTYRRYITSLELLDLLIERFNIPNPDFTEAANETFNSIKERDSSITVALRLEQRFRSVYKRRVQYRVLNFIIKWVKNSSYYKLDILPDTVLRSRLWDFLDTVDARNLSDNVTNIRKSLLGDRIRLIQTIEQPPPEQLDFGLVTSSDDVKLTTVHPLEFARQVTLYEWELYSRIEFWEVTGKEKIKSPNFELSLQFSNKFKCWLVSSIMSAEHLEDRMVIMQRVADLLIYFDSLNNLQGVQEAKAALLSSPVFRLSETYDALISKSKCHYRNFFESLRQFVQDDSANVYFTDYQEKLHRIHPPGLPFIAVGDKTQLIHLELKHPDWVNASTLPFSTVPDTQDSNSGCLVNFWKCRQLAELVEYYLSFQQTPYNFSINKSVRGFLETLNPLNTWGVDNESLFDDIMYEKSLKIQPKRSDSFCTVPRERNLKPVEIKIAAALNLVQPDPKLTADSREFRSLLQIISTVTNRSSTVTSASENQLVKESSNIPDKAVEQTSDKSNTVVSLTLNDPLSSLQISNDDSSLVSDTDKRSSHLKSFSMNTCTTTSSSPETFLHNDSSQFTSINTLPVNAHIKDDNAQIVCLSSPPPLPPRNSRSTQRNTHSEQFSNQISTFQESSHNISSSTFSNIRDISPVECFPTNVIMTSTHCDISQLPFDISLELENSSTINKSATCDDVDPPPRPSHRRLTSLSSVTGGKSPSDNSNINTNNLIDNVSSPPILPPRIHHHGGEVHSSRLSKNTSPIIQDNNTLKEDNLCIDSGLTNLSRILSNNVTNINRSLSSPLPPPLPPKKSTTPNT
uniref:Putative ras GTP exchange factor, son of sevenless n=1 Tax=Schistosoma mansoni TaxID=6183 RepID=A0A3Q0KEF3_SCHMA